MQFVTNTDNAGAFHWLQKATHKEGDTHPTLQAVNVTEERSIATDGVRLHIVRGKHYETGLYKVNKGKPLNKTAKAYECEEEVDAHYPEVDYVINSTEKKDLLATVAVNQQLLIDAASMPSQSGIVVLELRGSLTPVIIRSIDLEDDGKTWDTGNAFALVMPVQLSDKHRVSR